MNPRMWAHAATRANVETLRVRGVELIGPDEGELAEGDWGVGRLAEPEEIAARVEQLLAPGPLAGRRVLVTAGGTREPIDSVRFVGNRSSGRMGVALAARAAARGAEVTLVAANLGITAPPGIRVLPVGTAAELKEVCEREFASTDVLLMAAAVADFRPAAPVEGKIKKTDSPASIELERTEDVIAALARQRPRRQLLVGFAAEHGEDAVRYGRSKLEAKGLDAVVVNDISRRDIGFEAAANEVVIVTGAGERRVPRVGKEKVADAVLEEVQRLRSKSREEGIGGRARAHSTGAGRL